MLNYGKRQGFDPKSQPVQSVESYKAPVFSDVDPTSMAISFALIPGDDQPDDSTAWVAGLWDSATGWSNQVAYAFTPLIGKVGGTDVALEAEADKAYGMWWKIDTGAGQVVVRQFDQFTLSSS